MEQTRILIVEDDQTIAMGLEFALTQEGYAVSLYACLKDARDALSHQPFQLAILDINLPDGDGFSLCKEIKAHTPAPAVIFLTVHEEEGSAVMGLELGADDYITKPFRLRELLARIKADCLSIGPVCLYPAQARVTCHGQELSLTAMEYRLLLLFMRHPGQALTRNQLIQSLWDMDGVFVEDNTLSVYVRRLREKLGDTDSAAPLITTVRGLGYRMEA